MSQRESNRSRKIMKELRLKGYFCFKVHGGPTMMAGLPDIIVCAEGIFVGLETKEPDERDNVSIKQKLVHRKIRAANGHVAVVCSPSEALDAVEDALLAQSSEG
jgi:Holliday junction resolvase